MDGIRTRKSDVIFTVGNNGVKLASTFIEKTEFAVIEREALRADRFVHQCESARKYALGYKDANFFVKLAYQRAFLSQVRYIQGTLSDQVIDSLRQAVQDFIIGFELGYPAEAMEINNWFYRSLVVNDLSSSHFLAALPDELWPYGDEFPRFQARWGFAQLLGQKEQASQMLQSLDSLCLEYDDELATNEDEQRMRKLHVNSYHSMQAVFEKDSSSLIAYLQERAELRPIIPAEGTRYELFQPLDLIGLGLCRLAIIGGISCDIEVPSLPMALLAERNK
jgi:hypothetical protein